jgi:hypothetical protein
MVKQGCGARSITWLAILPSSGCYGKVFLIRMFCLGRCMYIEAGIRTVTTSYDDSNSTYPPHLSTQSFQRPRILAQPIDLSVLGAIFFLFERRCCDRQKPNSKVVQDKKTRYYHTQEDIIARVVAYLPSSSSGFTLIWWASSLIRFDGNLALVLAPSLGTSCIYDENE